MGVGFAKDGEGTGRNNRNMLLNQREKYFKKQNYKRKQKNSLKYKSASEEEIQKIKRKMLKQNRKEKRITLFVLFAFFLLISLLLLKLYL